MGSDHKISNVSGLQFFQLIRYASLIAIGILLAKSGIGQEPIGRYETFLMLGGVFSLFWVQGIIKGILPMLANENPNRQNIIFFNAFVLLWIFSLASALLLFVLNRPVSIGLLKGEAVPFLPILALYLLINSPAMLTEYLYLIRKQPRKIILYALVIFPLQIVAVGLPPFLGYPISVSCYGLTAISLIRLVWFLFALGRIRNLKPDTALIGQLTRLSTPLIVSTLLSSSAQYIDGFIITSKFSQADLAIFQYGARELPLALLLANSLSMAMVPRFALSAVESPLAELRSEVYRLGVFLFPISMAGLLLSHWAFPVFFNSGFEASATIFNIYLMLLVSRLLFPQTILMGKGLNGILVRASTLEIIINVGSSLWLASLFGIVGVAYGTFVAYLFEKIYLMIACFSKLKISPSKYLPVQQYLGFSVVLMVLFVVVEFILY